MSDQSSENQATERNPGDGIEAPGDAQIVSNIGSGASAAPQGPLNSPSDTTTSQAVATWHPNQELLDSIVALGFDKQLAEKALFYAGNDSVERAVNWIIDYGQRFDDGKPLDLSQLAAAAAEASAGDMSHKMVFVVNSALKMGIGKIAAQVGHATLGLYRDMLGHVEHETALFQWAEQGETKVVLKSEGGEEELVQLMNAAKQKSLPTYLVADAGRTQIASGSLTVLSIFGVADRVDDVTGKLKLLQ